MSGQTEFLKQHVLETLKQHGFNDLSQEDQQAYLPQFLAEAERRIGQYIIPHLSEETADSFIAMLDNENTTEQEWETFWKTSVPDYETHVQEALKTFSEDVGKAFAK